MSGAGAGHQFTPTVVIYHGRCRDGFCAAWVVHWRFPELPEESFIEGIYGRPPPDVTGQDVLLVDFSYPRDVLERMAEQAASLVILDHHKTAEAALRDFKHPRVTTVFDMKRSGAGIAWDTFFPGHERPPLVDYVEDRDLWNHRLKDTKVVNAWIATLPFTLRDWDNAATTMYQDQCETHDPLSWARQMGSGALHKTEQYVREAMKNARVVDLFGDAVPVVNAPQVDISELLDALAREHPGAPYVVGWWQRDDGCFQYSLRTRGSFDVSELAKSHGGGGHRQAAGFESDQLLVPRTDRLLLSPIAEKGNDLPT